MRNNKPEALISVVCCICGMTAPATATAGLLAPSPLAVRVAKADSILIGRVIELEGKREIEPRFPGDKQGVEFNVAIVKVENVFGNLANVKKIDRVRVGFQPLPPADLNNPPNGAGPDQLDETMVLTPQLVKGQQVCLFLTPNDKDTLYLAWSYMDLLLKKEESKEEFQNQIAEVKKLARLLEKSAESLQSKNTNDRFLTAAMLVYRYRNRRDMIHWPREEQIDAGQSKAILEALLAADWKTEQSSPMHLVPLSVFRALDLTPRDGWKTQPNAQNIAEEAQAWLKEHAGSYRLKRLVEKKPNHP